MADMTKEQMAARLDGREYGRDMITKLDIVAAKEAGLVIVYGASDDLMEFRGAICDEVDVYGGGCAWLDRQGVLDRDQIDDGDDEAITEYVRRKKSARKIDALWCDTDSIAWAYRTRIPHATFTIYEDGEPWCRGVVFSLGDLA